MLTSTVSDGNIEVVIYINQLCWLIIITKVQKQIESQKVWNHVEETGQDIDPTQGGPL